MKTNIQSTQSSDTAKKEKSQNEQPQNKMKKEIKRPKKEDLSEENRVENNKLVEEETQRAAEWCNMKLKHNTPKDGLEKELNNLMNKKSINETTEDNLSDKKSLMTADALGVGRPRINSTTKKKPRVDTLPKEEERTTNKNDTKNAIHILPDRQERIWPTATLKSTTLQTSRQKNLQDQ